MRKWKEIVFFLDVLETYKNDKWEVQKNKKTKVVESGIYRAK